MNQQPPLGRTADTNSDYNDDQVTNGGGGKNNINNSYDQTNRDASNEEVIIHDAQAENKTTRFSNGTPQMVRKML